MSLLHNPVILFFMFGIFAKLMRSNLEIPTQIAKFLSLYLLMAIGLKGGLAIHHSGMTPEVLIAMLIAIGMAIAVPLTSHMYLKRVLNHFDAAAVASTYGSISAVTFVTAAQYLDVAGIGHEDYMSAAMALMESPAIIIGMLLANQYRNTDTSIGSVFKDSFTEGANLLLLASMLIGLIVGDIGYAVMKPFTGDLFTGLLAFFLLDMGIQVANNLHSVRKLSRGLIIYGVAAPMLHAGVALLTCMLFSVTLSNTILLMVLCSSASYIAVPAALRESMPEANPSVYLGLSLGITFPFNVVVGIPLYYTVAKMAI